MPDNNFKSEQTNSPKQADQASLTEQTEQPIMAYSNPNTPQKTLLEEATEYGIAKVNKNSRESFLLAIYAGLFIAIAFAFYVSITTGNQSGSWGINRVVGALGFSLGLILVIVAGGELFTSTVLTIVARAKGLFSTKTMLACWCRVYLGNFVGSLLMVALVIMARMHTLNGGEWGINVLLIAQHKIHHSWTQALALGILCNLLVCLAVWMTFSTKDVLTKVILVILPVAMFVSSGFEHSVANMFMVPLGIIITSVVPPEFYTNHDMTASAFTDLTWYNFIVKNLIPVTIGNIIGGALFVGLGYTMVPSKKQP